MNELNDQTLCALMFFETNTWVVKIDHLQIISFLKHD